MKLRNTLLGLCLILLMGSCSSNKTVLPYFTDLTETHGSVPKGSFELTIVPDDELVINVTAANMEAVEQFNVPYQRTRTNDFNNAGNGTLESQIITSRNNAISYQTYRVNEAGFISFPVLGKLHVAGMTIGQLALFLEEKISAQVINPMVTVELVNFHVNVMGEVASPGARLVNRERYSILAALADAGDITPYGERKNVLLIREENGERVYHRLDLNDSESTLNSPYFYLRQNDVIYVEPNKIRQANAKVDQDKSFKLSMTSVIVSAASVVASLIIALFAK